MPYSGLQKPIRVHLAMYIRQASRTDPVIKIPGRKFHLIPGLLQGYLRRDLPGEALSYKSYNLLVENRSDILCGLGGFDAVQYIFFFQSGCDL